MVREPGAENSNHASEIAAQTKANELQLFNYPGLQSPMMWPCLYQAPNPVRRRSLRPVPLEFQR
jgi:hypothetical protein